MKLMAISALALVLSGCVSPRGFPPEHQIVNFDRVDERLYRGAQPTVNGLEFLHSIGVKSVVNLRLAHEVLPSEKPAAERLGMVFTNLPLSGVTTPTTEQMNGILDTIERLPAPVFIHCHYGCDRTGMAVSCWRIRHGWSREEALREAKAYGLSSLLGGMRRFILNFNNK